MKAVRIDQHGGPEVLRVVEVDDPVVGPGEVGVRVTHVGLNHLDVWVRRGVDSHPFPLPLIPGSDVVGIREDTGDTVALQPGYGCGQCGECRRGRHALCRHYAIRGETVNGGMCERVVVPSPTCCRVRFHQNRPPARPSACSRPGTCSSVGRASSQGTRS